jgi:hypothetical protein
MPRNKTNLAFLLSMLAVALMAGSAGAAGAAPSVLHFSELPWIPVATVAVLSVITVAAIVYALSGTISSTNARNWARVQIYEALLSLVLILIFGAFSYLFFINPQGAFGALNLVPSTAGTLQCNKAADIFQLASCDLSMFNLATFKLANVWYLMAFFVSMIPGLSINFAPIPVVAGLGASLGVGGIIPLIDPPLLMFAFGGTLTVMLLQIIQLIMISSSLLFLSLFLTLGLISRTFGFARSFGGAMIAFGLGLGLIYPLLTCVTYGYIDVHAHLDCLASSACQTLFSETAIFRAVMGLMTTTGSSMMSPFYLQLGYLLAGLTFIPFLNFIILDAFIIDFSQAIGERMDFMSLLAGIV